MSKLPDQNCNKCPNNNKCSEVYENLGKSSCKPVATSVSIAFLLPMVVFIITIALFQEYCGDVFASKRVNSLFSVFCGLVLSAFSVYIARLIRGKKSN